MSPFWNRQQPNEFANTVGTAQTKWSKNSMLLLKQAVAALMNLRMSPPAFPVNAKPQSAWSKAQKTPPATPYSKWEPGTPLPWPWTPPFPSPAWHRLCNYPSQQSQCHAGARNAQSQSATPSFSPCPPDGPPRRHPDHPAATSKTRRDGEYLEFK